MSYLNEKLCFVGEELLSQMHTSPSSIAEEVQETTDATTSNAEEENGEQSYSESY